MGYDTRRRSAASGSRNCKPKKRAAMASRRHGRAANVATNHGNRFHAKKYVGNVEGIFFLRSSAAEIIDSKETVSQPSPRARRALEADYHRNEGSYGKYSFHLFDVFFIAESFRLVRFPRLPEVSMESRKKDRKFNHSLFVWTPSRFLPTFHAIRAVWAERPSLPKEHGPFPPFGDAQVPVAACPGAFLPTVMKCTDCS